MVGMKLYTVTFHCPHCARMHGVLGGGPGLGLHIPQGPDHAGTVAQLWPKGNYPPSVTSLLRDAVWCDTLAAYIDLADPARLVLTPSPSPSPEPEQKNGPGAAHNAHPPGPRSSSAGLERNNPARG